MSLSTYAGLKDELAAWLRRSNITASSSVIDTGIDLFEAWAKRELMADEMLQQAVLMTVADQRDVDVPDGFRMVDTLRHATSPQPMNFVTRDTLVRMWGAQIGRPRDYTLGPYNDANACKTLRMEPVPDGAYELVLTYYANLVPLSNENPTNWLLAYAPDLYLFGSLDHLLTYLRDGEGKALVAPNLAAVIASVQADQARLKQPGAGQARATPTGMTP